MHHGTHTHPTRGRREERGNSLVEYVLLLSLIALVCIGALTYFGSKSGNSIVHSSDCIVTAGGPTPTC